MRMRTLAMSYVVGLTFFAAGCGKQNDAAKISDGAVSKVISSPESVTSALASSDGSSRANSETDVELPKAPSAKSVTVKSLSEAKSPGDFWTDNRLKMRFRWCPPGTFRMGLSDEEKDPLDQFDNSHETVDVQLSGFWIGEREVSQSEWQSLMGTTIHEQLKKSRDTNLFGVGGNYPMYFVSWIEAADFCEKLTEVSRESGQLPAEWRFSLPTEAEWEYACRAGTTTITNLGNRVRNMHIAYSGDHPFPLTLPGPVLKSAAEVGSLPPNSWGIHEMHGNVKEWCLDVYSEELLGGKDPLIEGDVEDDHITRGGSWSHAARLTRSGARMYGASNDRTLDQGFRVAIVRESE